MSGNKSRRKGAQYERDVAKHLDSLDGVSAKKVSGMYISGPDIRAEVDLPCRASLSLSVECKNHSRMSVPQWFQQCVTEAPDGCEPVLVCKHPGTSTVADDYVVMSMETFSKLIS